MRSVLSGYALQDEAPSHSRHEGASSCCSNMTQGDEEVKGCPSQDSGKIGTLIRYPSVDEEGFAMSADPPVGKDDFNRYIDRHDRLHSELNRRLIQDTVSMNLHNSDQRAIERRLQDLEREISEKADASSLPALRERLAKLEDRPANTKNFILALAGLGLTLLGIVVTAYFSSRGG